MLSTALHNYTVYIFLKITENLSSSTATSNTLYINASHYVHQPVSTTPYLNMNVAQEVFLVLIWIMLNSKKDCTFFTADSRRLKRLIFKQYIANLN